MAIFFREKPIAMLQTHRTGLFLRLEEIVKKNEKNSKKVLTEKSNAYIIVNVAGEQHQERQRMWEFSSAGRASALQAECRRFDPVNSHFHCGAVVQMVRMPACHAGGRGFDSHLRRIRLDSSVGRAED